MRHLRWVYDSWPGERVFAKSRDDKLITIGGTVRRISELMDSSNIGKLWQMLAVDVMAGYSNGLRQLHLHMFGAYADRRIWDTELLDAFETPATYSMPLRQEPQPSP
eukprot:6480067-Amphidinium_carterae.3